MDNSDYARLVGELCESVGGLSAKEIIATQHLTIDGRTVGLIFDENVSDALIFIYIDLGPCPVGCEEELRRRMLASNLRADATATGHFGVHPTTDNATYHVRLHVLPDLTGSELARFLGGIVQGLRAWSDRLLAAPARPTTNSTGVGRTQARRVSAPSPFSLDARS